jgi:hypothetical protein
MISTIKKAIKIQGAGEAVLYAGILGLVVSDIIPTPADAIYFRLQQKNKEKLNKGVITPKQYWTREAAIYYGLNPVWWSLVLLAVVNTKGGLDNKIRLGLALVGAGAVVGVLAKNIQEEEKLKKNSILNKKS